MNAVRTIADQLRPLAQAMRPTRRVRHVVQITGQLVGDNKDAAIEAAREHCLRWMQNRAGRLPDEAWKGRPFELSTPGKPAEVVTLDEGFNIWCARLDDQDKTVPGRVWTTEIAIARGGQDVLFGLRLLVAAPSDRLDFDPCIPGIVRQIAEVPGLVDYDVVISAEPTVLQNEDDVAGLIRLLTDSRRSRPVIVVALPEAEKDPASALVDVDKLASGCVGVAHVVVLSGPLSYCLTDRLGKEYSVFNGGVRTYLPGFTPVLDRPFSHPLALPNRIAEWGPEGASDFERFLIGTAFTYNTRRPNLEKDLPPFPKIKQLSLDRRREAAARSGDVHDQLNIALAQLKEEKANSRTAEDLAEEEESKRLAVEADRDEQVAHVYRLSARVENLEAQLKAAGRPVDATIEIPDSLNEVQTWADRYLAGRLTVHERAVRAAKNSTYQDVSLAYQSLLFLAHEYCDMKRGTVENGREVFQARLQELGLSCEPSFSGKRWGEQGDTYLVRWNGRKEYLDMHLKKGNARDEARSLRIYFFWDPQRREVVVGSMPAHLETRASR